MRETIKHDIVISGVVFLLNAIAILLFAGITQLAYPLLLGLYVIVLLVTGLSLYLRIRNLIDKDNLLEARLTSLTNDLSAFETMMNINPIVDVISFINASTRINSFRDKITREVDRSSYYTDLHLTEIEQCYSSITKQVYSLVSDSHKFDAVHYTLVMALKRKINNESKSYSRKNRF